MVRHCDGERLNPLPENTTFQAYGSPIVKKKRSHDLAYLLIILAALFGTFLFVMVMVNSLLQTIP